MVKRPPGTLRIIGGEWRRRLIEFDASAGVRPTPDRVRQTLFDWLTPVIEGACCLDLFAGSGALGLEALSRGAAHVTFVETGARQVVLIQAALKKLGASEHALIANCDARSFMPFPLRGGSGDGGEVSTLPLIPSPQGRGEKNQRGSAYDIVFLDPPFDSGLLTPALERLPRILKPGNRVYLEWHRGGAVQLPAGYTLLREKKAGRVSYALATFAGASP